MQKSRLSVNNGAARALYRARMTLRLVLRRRDLSKCLRGRIRLDLNALSSALLGDVKSTIMEEKP